MPALINQKPYLPDFIRLHEAGIAHYFRIEETDRGLARNPALSGATSPASSCMRNCCPDDRDAGFRRDYLLERVQQREQREFKYPPRPG